MHYLYRITNQLNGKVYIGQTVDAGKRWVAHKSFARNDDKPRQYIHHAIAKYGSSNFVFEVIATCRTQEDTDAIEDQLIQQYDSRNKEKGYNLKTGGSHGIHSEETKQKQSEATYRQITTQGHPAQGRIVTEEEKELHRKARLENPIEYTEELRQKMSEAHIGIKDSEETKQRKAESAKEAWEKRIDYSRKCEAPGCEVSGKVKYKIIDGVRYCNKHGLRKLRELDRL
jgi:group I intron endonuclease